MSYEQINREDLAMMDYTYTGHKYGYNTQIWENKRLTDFEELRQTIVLNSISISIKKYLRKL